MRVMACVVLLALCGCATSSWLDLEDKRREYSNGMMAAQGEAIRILREDRVKAERRRIDEVEKLKTVVEAYRQVSGLSEDLVSSRTSMSARFVLERDDRISAAMQKADDDEKKDFEQFDGVIADAKKKLDMIDGGVVYIRQSKRSQIDFVKKTAIIPWLWEWCFKEKKKDGESNAGDEGTRKGGADAER